MIQTVGVTYQTSYEKLQRIPALLQEAVGAQERAAFARAHFKEYLDSAPSFEVVYHVKDPSFQLFMDVRQAVNLGIYERFQKEGITFARPTQMLYVSDLGDRAEPP